MIRVHWRRMNLLNGQCQQGRILTATEQALIRYLGEESETHACAIAPHVYLPTGLTPREQEQVIEQAVIGVLCDALESIHGTSRLEYVGGTRRDTLRGIR